MMLLGAKQIQEKRIITGAQGAFVDVGYNVRAEAYIDADGTRSDEYTLQPGRIVWAVSQERICLPKDVMAYATIKTSMCQKGLLALNIGIIDPGWCAPISTPILNFGKKEIYLKKREEFLRLTFHQFQREGEPKKDIRIWDDYFIDTKQKAIEHFGDSFMNVEQEIMEVNDRIFKRNLSRYSGVMALAALCFGLLTFVISAGIGIATSYFRADVEDVADYRQVREDLNALRCDLAQSNGDEVASELYCVHPEKVK